MRPLLIALVAVTGLHTTPAAASPFDEAMAIVSDPKVLNARADEAERLFRTASSDPERGADAAFNLGLLLKRRGDVAGARGAWQTALQTRPDHLPAKAELAGLDLKSGAAEQAVKVLEGIVESDRFQPEARNHLAAWELSRDNFDEAIRHGRNALLGDPDNINAFLNVAIAYFRKGLPDQAGLIASSALEKNPKAAGLHNLMGLVFLSQDNSRAATEAFTAALDADPNNDDARLNLAALELAYGNFEAALKRFDQALKQRPDAVDVIVSRAVAHRGLSRFDEAEAGYRKAMSLPGAPMDIEYNLCILHHQYTQNYPTAQEVCAAFLAKLPDDHPKRSEVTRRVRAIEATLRALQSTAPSQ